MGGRGTWVLQSKRLKFITIEGKWVQNLQWKRMETMTNTHLTRIGFARKRMKNIMNTIGFKFYKEEDKNHDEHPPKKSQAL
jgi:hypothetical protein